MGFGQYNHGSGRNMGSSSHAVVAKHWANDTGTEAQRRGKRLFCEGRVAYSHGSHYVAGFMSDRRHTNGRRVAFIQTESPSGSTSAHLGKLREAAWRAGHYVCPSLSPFQSSPYDDCLAYAGLAMDALGDDAKPRSSGQPIWRAELYLRYAKACWELVYERAAHAKLRPEMAQVAARIRIAKRLSRARIAKCLMARCAAYALGVVGSPIVAVASVKDGCAFYRLANGSTIWASTLGERGRVYEVHS